ETVEEAAERFDERRLLLLALQAEAAGGGAQQQAEAAISESDEAGPKHRPDRQIKRDSRDALRRAWQWCRDSFGCEQALSRRDEVADRQTREPVGRQPIAAPERQHAAGDPNWSTQRDGARKRQR